MPSSSTNPAAGPHQTIEMHTDSERFLAQLFDALWHRYRQRVVHVQSYEQVVARHGARLVNDHIAFRTFACQQPHTGIASLSRPFEALGYRAAGVYTFEDKFLQATHYQHPHGDLPKLFISELQVWRLGSAAQQIIYRTLADHRPPLDSQLLRGLVHLGQADDARRAELLQACVQWIEQRPWSPPQKEDVIALNAETQYGAWVLLHGYNVNHFTALINAHGVSALDDIEKTVAALKDAGVPMKDDIEGQKGSVLRQTATAAAVIDVPVMDGSAESQMSWTYAYFELAERGYVTHGQSGERHRFEGFLGPQATQLFEMTRRN